MSTGLLADAGRVVRLPPGGGPVVVRHPVPGFSERWVLPEEPVPESALHDLVLELLVLLLRAWAARVGRDARVFRNLAIRVTESRPQLGFDPDVCVVEPAPPEPELLESLKLWEPAQRAPVLAFEVVSRNHPYKDYAESPAKCAAVGVAELVVFDPLLAGPKALGGPQLLQVWRRAADGGFDLAYAGSGPCRSETLDAWLVVTDAGSRLRMADDAAGERLWPTPEEAERAAKEEALARIAGLESLLAKRDE